MLSHHSTKAVCYINHTIVLDVFWEISLIGHAFACELPLIGSCLYPWCCVYCDGAIGRVVVFVHHNLCSGLRSVAAHFRHVALIPTATRKPLQVNQIFIERSGVGHMYRWYDVHASISELNTSSQSELFLYCTISYAGSSYSRRYDEYLLRYAESIIHVASATYIQWWEHRHCTVLDLPSKKCSW